MEGTAKDLVMALEGLEREKNIKREDILKTIEDALVSALRKNLGKTAQISAKIDVENGSIKAFQTLNVVELVTNPEMEIDVEGAKKHLKNPKVGDVVTITLEVEDFSRIAAQIAKQVLIQKVRGIERDNFYKEFKPREGEVVTGSVRRFSDLLHKRPHTAGRLRCALYRRQNGYDLFRYIFGSLVRACNGLGGIVKDKGDRQQHKPHTKNLCRSSYHRDHTSRA